MTYTIISLETGNLIGAYSTHEEALVVIRDAVTEFGPGWTDDYALATLEERRLTPIAEGAELATLAMAAEAPGVR